MEAETPSCARSGGRADEEKSSSRTPTSAPRSCRAHAIRGDRARPGSVSIGWETPEVSQLVALGPGSLQRHLWHRAFLAAHAAVAGRKSSGSLALAALAHLRKSLRSRTAARMARSLGHRRRQRSGLDRLCADRDVGAARRRRACSRMRTSATELFTDDLIAADKQLDVMGGSAGAILGLLRLYRRPNPAMRSGARRAAASPAGVNAASDRRAAAAGAH